MAKLRILYNDRCPICRAEIRHYQARAEASGAALSFDDLNAADLDHWRLTPEQAKRRLHAMTPDGQIISGVPAFALIWERLPGYGWLARLVRVPGLRGLAEFSYNHIAAPWLYAREKRRAALEGSGARP